MCEIIFDKWSPVLQLSLGSSDVTWIAYASFMGSKTQILSDEYYGMALKSRMPMDFWRGLN